MNTLEQFIVQLHSSNNQLIAEQCPRDHNLLFELVYDFHNTPAHDIHHNILFLSTHTLSVLLTAALYTSCFCDVCKYNYHFVSYILYIVILCCCNFSFQNTCNPIQL